MAEMEFSTDNVFINAYSPEKSGFITLERALKPWPCCTAQNRQTSTGSAGEGEADPHLGV